MSKRLEGKVAVGPSAQPTCWSTAPAPRAPATHASRVAVRWDSPMKAMTPLQRCGGADDIAMACLYLASDESAFVTGEVISPNGGLVID